MKNYLVAFILTIMIIFPLSSFGGNEIEKQNKSESFIELSFQQILPLIQIESKTCNEQGQDFPGLLRRGCCSWHGGVCGCDDATDRIVCCDGTYSPSCRCSEY